MPAIRLGYGCQLELCFIIDKLKLNVGSFTFPDKYLYKLK